MLESMLANFHFLRPEWLWALLPTAAVYLLVTRRLDPERQLRRLVAPHLLTHLRVGASSGLRVRPIQMTTMVGLVATLGLAGPTWDREVSPFAEDAAPLVIVLDASLSMDAVDVQPTRLERAKQKIRDLIALRPGARTALVAYAGSAHTVLPLSDDVTMFESFLDGLDSSVMPESGKDPAEALLLAEEILARDSVPGSILFITDGIASEYAPAFSRHAENSRDEVMVLAVGTTAGGPVRTGANEFATDAQGRRIVATLDREGLDVLAREAGVFVAGATVDDADVERLQSRVQSHLRVAQQDDPTARWRDFGYFFVYPVALIALFWFRKGWTVRWATALLVLGTTACTQPGGRAGGFTDLWLTPDQQGRFLFERARYDEAADRFENVMWEGTARYRAGDMDGAIQAFARSAEPEAHFALGNSYARLGSFEASVASYDLALEARPDWTEARENRDLVLALIPPPPDEEEEGERQALPPHFDPDEIQFDERGEEGERGEIDERLVSDEQLTEMWMRRLQTSPGDFLRRRFAIEAAQRATPPDPGGGS